MAIFAKDHVHYNLATQHNIMHNQKKQKKQFIIIQMFHVPKHFNDGKSVQPMFLPIKFETRHTEKHERKVYFLTLKKMKKKE